MADVTPLLGPDAKIIQNYTARGFRINGGDYLGAIIIAGDEVLPLQVVNVTELKPVHLDGLLRFEVSYLIIGAAKAAMLDAALLTTLKSRGTVAEVMELGAACRTFNVLRAEGRQVAAALIPAGPPPEKNL